MACSGPMARSARCRRCPKRSLAGDFRRAVLAFLVKERAITDELRVKMLGWRYCGGFSAKRNFQVMPGAQWLELLCKHIPDRHEHLVRYVGWYSNRARGERAKVLEAQQPATAAPAAEAAVSEFASRAKASWARLIRKVYEADPLVCPKCNGPMRVIALIDDPAVVRRILEHLGRIEHRTCRAG